MRPSAIWSKGSQKKPSEYTQKKKDVSYTDSQGYCLSPKTSGALGVTQGIRIKKKGKGEKKNLSVWWDEEIKWPLLTVRHLRLFIYLFILLFMCKRWWSGVSENIVNRTLRAKLSYLTTVILSINFITVFHSINIDVNNRGIKLYILWRITAPRKLWKHWQMFFCNTNQLPLWMSATLILRIL